MKREAMYWEKMEGGKARCHLCPHNCLITEGKFGVCRNKKNEGGTIYAPYFAEITALSMDPIEKKPLYHFYPGRSILSIGTRGCNLSCSFCQNYHLWDGEVRTEPLPPEEAVEAAKRNGSFGIAYTYNEPYMSYEYVIECARLAREAGVKNVLVTNGYYNEEPFEELLPYVDAMNIDIKSIRDDFYKKLCKGKAAPVMKTIERANEECSVEVTNLIITDENDSDEDLGALVDWVASVDPAIPIHFSAYRPMYKMENPATSIERLLRAYELAREKLRYVYLGNVVLDVGQHSYCPHCGEMLVERNGYRTRIKNLEGESCKACGEAVNFKNE